MRAYEETITWLTFQAKLRQASPTFWLLLGDLSAGLRHLNGIPLAAAEARSVERDLVVHGVHARLALDGLLVPSETVRQRIPARGKSTPAGAGRQEVEAYLGSLQPPTPPEAGAVPSSPGAEDLKRLHRSVMEASAEEERQGHWRVLPTGGRPWEGVPPEVAGLFAEELCDWLKSDELAAPAPDDTAAYAVIRMLLAELYLAWIRPFAAGHFRVSGAFGAAILRHAGMDATAVHLLSSAMHRHAGEFQRHVQHASEGPADPTPFVAFALRGMTEVLHETHARVRDLQMRGQWRAQLLELFQEGNDEPTRRQRQVLLDLATTDRPVPLNRLSSLSPILAKLYAGVSEKTLRRDVDALLGAGVLQRDADGLRVDLSNVLAFKG